MLYHSNILRKFNAPPMLKRFVILSTFTGEFFRINHAMPFLRSSPFLNPGTSGS